VIEDLGDAVEEDFALVGAEGGGDHLLLGADEVEHGLDGAPGFHLGAAHPEGDLELPLPGVAVEQAAGLAVHCVGQRRELDAIEDPEAREREFQAMVERMYQYGKAVNTASHFEIDDVIDPAESRRWITTMLAAAPTSDTHSGKKRPNIDTW